MQIARLRSKSISSAATMPRSGFSSAQTMPDSTGAQTWIEVALLEGVTSAVPRPVLTRCVSSASKRTKIAAPSRPGRIWQRRGAMMRLVRAMVVFVCLVLLGAPARAEIRIVAVGDSSFRGGPSMANPDDAFPARLQAALRAKGYDVSVANAGVNGE